jgi:hypothetical protein
MRIKLSYPGLEIQAQETIYPKLYSQNMAFQMAMT